MATEQRASTVSRGVGGGGGGSAIGGSGLGGQAFVESTPMHH